MLVLSSINYITDSTDSTDSIKYLYMRARTWACWLFAVGAVDPLKTLGLCCRLAVGLLSVLSETWLYAPHPLSCGGNKTLWNAIASRVA